MVQATAFKRIVYFASAIRCDYHNRRLSGLYRTKFRNGYLEVRQYLKQESLKGFVSAVQLIDQQYRRFAFSPFQRLKQRPLDQKFIAKNACRRNLLLVIRSFLHADFNHLRSIVPLIYSRTYIKTFITLQANKRPIKRRTEDFGYFRFANTGLTFEKQWTSHLKRQE